VRRRQRRERGPVRVRSSRALRLSAGGTYGFDTRQLPEGTHNLKILVEDAAGNSATVSNRNVVVDNIPDPSSPVPVPAPEGSAAGSGGANTTTATSGGSGPGSGDRGAPNGTNAADDARLTAYWAKTRGSVLKSRYGVRHLIRGRLTGRKGKGIANARVELAATPAARGALQSLDRGGARTRPDGSWTLILPADVSSRMLSARYRSHANDRVPAVTRTLRLSVSAGIRLSVTPRVAARGRTIRLAGRLLGRPAPRGGKVLELQARTPGTGWVTFSTVRTDRSGSFAARYTFRRGGPVTYELRLHSRASSDYPFDMGASAAARVRVR
jgi:Bacterial Ig-like domain